MDDAPTKVVFRQWRTKPHEFIALFPEIPADLNGYLCESYMHVGQHGGADYQGVVAATIPVDFPTNLEAQELAEELEGRGYVLRPVLRCTYRMDRARFDEARRIREYKPANA